MKNGRPLPDFNARGDLHRTLQVRSSNQAERTIELAFSSEEPVERHWGLEILDHSPSSVKLDRLREGGALLVNHDWDDQIGVVESVSIDADRRGRAVVRFGKGARANEIFLDVVDGIRRHVSVGYRINQATHEGTQGDLDVYRVTDWAPFEISIVSVPADITVGVGRSLNDQKREPAGSLKCRPPVLPLKDNRTQPMINPLIDLMDRSKRMPATNVHTRHDGTVVVMGDKPRVPPAGCDFSLRELMLPANFGGSVDYRVHFPMGEAAGRQTTLSTALMKVSRVAKAGAVIFMVDESPKPVSQAGGILVYPQHKKSFLTIEAADFAVVADGAEVGISTLPVFRSEVDLANMTTYGFRVEMNRSEMKNFEEGLLSDTALASIYMGVVRIADKALLDAINATNPPAFSLAAVAAKGYEFAELRALIGTNADKAEIGQDGTLRAGGLLAELTPDSVTTLAGSWPRAAVAVHERITLTVQLLNPMTGSMAVTCWVHCQPMLPDASAFWTVPGEVSLMSFGVNSLDEPADEPPVDETPVDEPPVEEPPVEEPPVEEPPVEPEATEPPVEPGV